jgi:hypothetical protein
LENCGSLQILAGNPSGAKLLVAYTVDTHIVAPASREEQRKWRRDMKTLIDARCVYFVNTAHGSVAGAADGEAEKRELSVRADQESAGSSSGKNASDLQNSRADKVSELLKNVLAFDSIFSLAQEAPNCAQVLLISEAGRKHCRDVVGRVRGQFRSGRGRFAISAVCLVLRA